MNGDIISPRFEHSSPNRLPSVCSLPFHLWLRLFSLFVNYSELRFRDVICVLLLKTDTDVPQRTYEGKKYSITTQFRECAHYPLRRWWWKKRSSDYLLASHRNCLFSTIRWFNFIFSPFASPVRPTENACKHYISNRSAFCWLLAARSSCCYTLVIFRALAVPLFRCSFHNFCYFSRPRSSLLTVQQLQTQNECLLTRRSLFSLSRSSSRKCCVLSAICIGMHGCFRISSASVALRIPNLISAICCRRRRRRRRQCRRRKIVCLFVCCFWQLGQRAVRTCVFPLFSCIFASMLLFSFIHCLIQLTMLLHSVSREPYRCEWEQQRTETGGGEREHTMQRSTSERDMQRSCIMIINTVIVIHCIYLIVTSPLQHFRFGFHNSFLRSSLELDSSFKYIWTFVGFAHAPCVPSSSSLQMVLIELLKWPVQSSQVMWSETGKCGAFKHRAGAVA